MSLTDVILWSSFIMYTFCYNSTKQLLNLDCNQNHFWPMMILVALSVFNCSKYIFLNIKEYIDRTYLETVLKKVHIFFSS